MKMGSLPVSMGSQIPNNHDTAFSGVQKSLLLFGVPVLLSHAEGPKHGALT